MARRYLLKVRARIWRRRHTNAAPPAAEAGMQDTAGRFLLDTAGRFILDTTGT